MHKFGTKSGFTLLELIVVIAVIAILASLVTVGFTKFQSESRDARRTASVGVIAEALEKYYDEHGEYPGCSTITGTLDTVVQTTLVNVDRGALVAPLAVDKNANSIRCATLTVNGEDFYEYSGDGSSTCSSGASCLSYVIKYKDEANGGINTLASRHNASVVTSGTPTLSGGSVTYTTASLSWTAPDNVVSYNLQRASSCAGLSGSPSEFTVNGTSVTQTGLTMGATYCYRIAGKASNGQLTNYSNTVTMTTNTLAVPVPSISGITNTQLTVSWPAVSGAASYDLEQTTGSFTGTPTLTGITGSGTVSSVRSGLTTGVPYSFKVRSVATDNGSTIRSNWSATATGTPLLPTPTNLTVAWTNNYGSSSHSATCSIGTPQFRRATTYWTNGSRTDNWGAWTAYTTSTTFASDFIAEGMFGKVKVMAKCVGTGGAESPEVESATIQKIRPITSITAYTEYARTTSPALVNIRIGCVSGWTGIYNWGEIYHGSAGYHSVGGWGYGDYPQVTNGPPNWSMTDGLNAYRISRAICQTPYYERSTVSYVAGATLQGSALTNFNNFVYYCNVGSYCYGVER